MRVGECHAVLVDSVLRRELLSADPPLVTEAPAELLCEVPHLWRATRYRVVLRPWPPYRLGRVFLVCPSCDRRVGRLYQPHAGLLFKCRTCYRLAYFSNQTSHKLPIGLLRALWQMAEL